MRLLVVTPRATVVDSAVTHVRAEDASGAFGVLARHADLLTVLAVSVLVYRDGERREHFVAVRGGLFKVSGGDEVQVLTREAVTGDDLAVLERDVLARFHEHLAEEERGHRGAERLEGALLERVADYAKLERTKRARGLV